MTEGPRLETRAAQPYAAIRTYGCMDEWDKVNARLFEVAAWLAERNIPLAGPPVYRYWKVWDNDTQFDLEVGWLVDCEFVPDERVHAGEIPSGRYLATSHHGHPDRISETFSSMLEWADQHDIEPATRHGGEQAVWDGWFELYMTDPRIEPDLNKWRTDLLVLTREETT